MVDIIIILNILIILYILIILIKLIEHVYSEKFVKSRRTKMGHNNYTLARSLSYVKKLQTQIIITYK